MSEPIAIEPPLKAIRSKCLDCAGHSPKAVDRCVFVNCPLYHFRNGKNPNVKPRRLTDQARKDIGARLLKSRQTKKTM